MIFHLLLFFALAYVVVLSACEDVATLFDSVARPTSSLHWPSNASTTVEPPRGTSGASTCPTRNDLSPSASRHFHSVDVGPAGNLTFWPDRLNASVGDVVRFNFLALNHTLTQSEFSDPCKSNGRLDTGFRQFNPLNESGRFLVDLEVNSTDPQWFYCAQERPASHCHKGMVFGLNPAGLMDRFINNSLRANSTRSLASGVPLLPIATNGLPTAVASFNQTSINVGVAHRSSRLVLGIPLLLGSWTVIWHL